MTDEYQPSEEEMKPAPETVTDPSMPTPEAVEAVEAFNLLPDLLATDEGKDWVAKEASRVVSRTKTDEEKRSDFMKRRANQLKLLTGLLETLKFPTEGAKPPHIPLLLQAMLAHWSRIWDQVMPSKGDIVHLAATSFEDEERERRVEKHFNWYLRVRIPEYVAGHAQSIMQWLLSGSTFRDYRWDPIRKCCCIDHVPIDDMVIPYAEKDIDPLMSSVSRKTRIRRLARHVLEEWEKAGYYVGVAELYENSKGAVMRDDDSKVKDIVEKIDGVEKPDSVSDEKNPDAEREILEQHYWTSIPGVEGIKPVKFTVDRLSKKPLALTIREMDDPLDRARYELENQEYTAAQQSMQQQMAMNPAMLLEPPPPPKPVRTTTLNTIIHYQLFPNPEGFYGLGAGYLLEGPNDLVDNLLADLMVAGKFQNVQSGWISSRVQFKKGDVEFVHGKLNSVDCEPDEMAKAIRPATFPPPSPTLMEIAKWQVEEAKSQTANADTLAGEQGTSRETAESVKARNDNANQVVNVMTRLYLVPMAYELRLIMHGLSVYLEDEEYFAVIEPSKEIPGQMKQYKGKAGRLDYLEDYDISPTADARMSSKSTRIQEAFGLMDRVQQSTLMKDPQRGPMLAYMTMKNVFTALERPDFLAAIGDPPAPAPPPSPESQETENAGFLNERDHPVFPDDDDGIHLAGMDAFEQDPHFAYLSPTGKQLFDRHRRAHVAQHYQKQQGAINGAPAQAMGTQSGGGGGIPPGRANGTPPGGPAQAPPRPAPNGTGHGVPPRPPAGPV
jgi:hypothetical protein